MPNEPIRPPPIDDVIKTAPVIIAPATVIAPDSEVEHAKQAAGVRSELALGAAGDRSEAALKGEASRVEDSLRALGQRKINLVWEYTQSGVASIIVCTTCGAILGITFLSKGSSLPPEWWTIVGLVIGFYFGRTNHQRIGGVGANDHGR